MTNNGSQILLALSDRVFAPFAEKALRQAGLLVATTDDAETITRAVGRLNVDVLVLDLDLPGRDPLELIAEVRGAGLAPEVIVTSAAATFEQAVEAMRRTAFDFIRQPIGAEALVRTVSHAVERHRLARENTVLRRVAAQQPFTGPIVSASQRIQDVLHKLKTVAASRAPVLFTGETGTGKGLMAKTLHLASGREPFLQINCGALQEALFESELFGHLRGAFTGAVESKPGLFEVADGGTIFLDEVSELKPVMQAKLLQVLDTQEIRPVGGTVEKTVDVRVVAATNGDLEKEIAAGRFRRDLFFRLNVVQIRMPPLRDRREDVPLLLDYYLERFHVPGTARKRFADPVLDLLASYSWPGNVRELANTVETAVLLSRGDTIDVDDLPHGFRPNPISPSEADDLSEPLPLDEIERRHLMRTLEYTGGLKARAARILGIDVKTLNRKLRSYRVKGA
ncbi:MAG TPA: sigma-54 dependent transcriptional regulator [Thermoanaerobaculia bacterium]|jgi:DNA-binding NtrC family response regulator|nr:sigma-54 dependent transcriptional regulator [Thermoanaerobaculia bacterium]